MPREAYYVAMYAEIAARAKLVLLQKAEYCRLITVMA